MGSKLGSDSWDWRRLIIAVIVGFLVLYHVAKIVDIYSDKAIEISAIVHIQTAARLFVVSGLLLVLFRIRYAIVWMWLAISGLVILQYVTLLDSSTFDELSVPEWLSYLRGFIAPTIVTLIYRPSPRRLAGQD